MKTVDSHSVIMSKIHAVQKSSQVTLLNTLVRNNYWRETPVSTHFLLRKATQGAQFLPVTRICPPLWLGLLKEVRSFDQGATQKWNAYTLLSWPIASFCMKINPRLVLVWFWTATSKACPLIRELPASLFQQFFFKEEPYSKITL